MKKETKCIPLEYAKRILNGDDFLKLKVMMHSYEKITNNDFDYDEMVNYILSEDFGRYEDGMPVPREIVDANRENNKEVQERICIYDAMKSWSAHKQIYNLQPEIIDALLKTEISTIPKFVFTRLPFYSMYLDTSAYSYDINGCLVSVKRVGEDIRLIYVLIKPPESITATSFMINYTDTDAINFCVEDVLKNNDIFTKELILLTIQFMMYLATNKPDIEESAITKKTYKPSNTIRNKFSEVRMWDVGVRFGEAVRLSKEAIAKERKEHDPNKKHVERKRPRSHVRKAHWHTYLCGTGRKTPILKWIPPLIINNYHDDLPAMIRGVEK